jgi:cell division protein FtsB
MTDWDLRDAYEDANAEIKRLRAENAQLEKLIIDFKEDQRQRIADNRRLQNKLDSLHTELAEWNELTRYAKSLGQKTYLEIHAENDRLRAQNEKLSEMNNMLVDENAKLRDKT